MNKNTPTPEKDQVRLVWPDGKTVILNQDGSYYEEDAAKTQHPSHPLPNRNPSKPPLESTEGAGDRETEPPGMKWAKFLQFFALWAGAIFSLIASVIYFAGNTTASAQLRSAGYYGPADDMRVAELLYGFACLAGCVLNIIAWVCLYQKKKSTKIWTTACYAVSAGCNLLFIIAASLAIRDPYFNVGTIASIIIQGVIAACNYRYFENRSEIFAY